MSHAFERNKQKEIWFLHKCTMNLLPPRNCQNQALNDTKVRIHDLLGNIMRLISLGKQMLVTPHISLNVVLI